MRVTVWKHVNDREVTVTLDTTVDLAPLIEACGLVDNVVTSRAASLAAKLNPQLAFRLMEAWARALLDGDDHDAARAVGVAAADIRAAYGPSRGDAGE